MATLKFSQKNYFWSAHFLSFFHCSPFSFSILILIQNFILFIFQYGFKKQEKNSLENDKGKRKSLDDHIQRQKRLILVSMDSNQQEKFY